MIKLTDFNSIARRLNASYFLTSLLVLCTFSTTTFFAVKHYFYLEDHYNIEQKFKTIDKLRIEGDFIFKFGDIFATGETKLWVISSNKLIYNSQNVALPDDFSIEGHDSYLDWSSNGAQYRARLFPLANSPGRYAILGTNIDHQLTFLQNFRRVLLLSTVIASFVSGILGWLVVSRGLKPLGQFEEHVKNISTNRLDIRIPTNDFPTELLPLVVGFNEMLDRLEEDFERLSEFSSDIAHEFRTPIANMMTQIQVALAKTRTVDMYQDILVSNIEELDRLTKTISDMLYLAKSEHNLLLKTNEEIDLNQLSSELCEFYQLAGDDKSLIFELKGHAKLIGDRAMIKRSIGNLLSNAVRHSDENTVIIVDIHKSETHIVITITNKGDTIPQQYIPYIFDRFYRVDKSRAHTSSSGSGLGLPIARSIARIHNGDISVNSYDGITTFTISLGNMVLTS